MPLQVGAIELMWSWPDAKSNPPPADAFLIRPDGYVAWVASAQDADDEAELQLRHALETWFVPKADLVFALSSNRGGL